MGQKRDGLVRREGEGIRPIFSDNGKFDVRIDYFTHTCDVVRALAAVAPKQKFPPSFSVQGGKSLPSSLHPLKTFLRESQRPAPPRPGF